MNKDQIQQVLLDEKYARIIECMSEMYHVSLTKAMDIFYNSETAALINDGIADLHCRSDKYLAGEIWTEYQEQSSDDAK